MLTHLHISNYVLIDALDIDIADGFVALTGETGAGKSIIMGALGLLLGGRADARAIKEGASKCCVEAVFDATNDEGLRPLVEAAGADFDPETCILRREVSATGKSRAFINDTPVALTALRETGAHLVDIHSQHQNLLLHDEAFLLAMLDTVGAHTAECAAYAEAYAAFMASRQRLERLRAAQSRSAEETDFDRFRLDEIAAARLVDGEQEELEAEARMLAHAEEIKAALYEAGHLISSESRDMTADLRRAAAALEGVARELPLAAELAARIDSARIELADIAAEAENALDNTDFDPARSEFVNARLDTIYALEKKYRADNVAALLELARTLRQKLDAAENSDERLAEAEKAAAQAEKTLAAAAEILNECRHKAARTLETALAERLRPLGMPSVRLEVRFTPRQQPEASGAERAALFFSANAGVALQDAAHTASGGEVARLMLALKALLSARSGLPTVVFDEIDTGVSGAMAGRMGLLMSEMGRTSQVVCITHLPQIAALASAHYRVYKVEQGGRTTTHIARLSPEERVDELATLLSGGALTEAARQNARSLLSGGRDEAPSREQGAPKGQKTRKTE